MEKSNPLPEVNISPFDLGWADGYDDLLTDCPYAEGTPEYDEYMDGYYQGSMDC